MVILPVAFDFRADAICCIRTRSRRGHALCARCSGPVRPSSDCFARQPAVQAAFTDEPFPLAD